MMKEHVIDGEATESDSDDEREVLATVCMPIPLEAVQPACSSYVVSGEAEESDEENKVHKKDKSKLVEENAESERRGLQTQQSQTQLRHLCLLQMRLWECNVMLHHSARGITDTTATHNTNILTDTATMLLATQENIRGAANNFRAANARLRSTHFQLKLGLAGNVLANVRIPT